MVSEGTDELSGSDDLRGDELSGLTVHTRILRRSHNYMYMYVGRAQSYYRNIPPTGPILDCHLRMEKGWVAQLHPKNSTHAQELHILRFIIKNLKTVFRNENGVP